ncbi:MAG: hypothetical protein JWL68_411, partial [Actinomycetia bacterium]|nr:hypothetical protein [Actinomycetes bacterium]
RPAATNRPLPGRGGPRLARAGAFLAVQQLRFFSRNMRRSAAGSRIGDGMTVEHWGVMETGVMIRQLIGDWQPRHPSHTKASDWSAKSPPDLRSPLTESNRRPFPYHPHFRGFTARQALPTDRRRAPVWLLPRPGSCPGLRRLRSLRPSRLQPSSSWHGSMPSVCSVRPRLVCQAWPPGLYAGQPRPLRRSKDGQTIFPIPAAQGPKTTLSRRFPIAGK